jgi:hypothetical protein
MPAAIAETKFLLESGRTLETVRHHRNQVIARLNKHHALLRECVAGDVITINCLFTGPFVW